MVLQHHNNNNYFIFFIILIISTVHVSTLVSADSIHGCGGFVESSSSLIKSRKATDSKFDYSDISVELRTLDGLVKDRTQCAPNGYYFMPVYDKFKSSTYPVFYFWIVIYCGYGCIRIKLSMRLLYSKAMQLSRSDFKYRSRTEI
ncbi:hypothetical protein Tco_0617752 [Tanacetum coccineum]